MGEGANWFKNGSKMVQEWFKNGSKMVQKWFKNGSKMVQKWFKRIKNGSKVVQKWAIWRGKGVEGGWGWANGGEGGVVLNWDAR